MWIGPNFFVKRRSHENRTTSLSPCLSPIKTTKRPCRMVRKGMVSALLLIFWNEGGGRWAHPGFADPLRTMSTWSRLSRSPACRLIQWKSGGKYNCAHNPIVLYLVKYLWVSPLIMQMKLNYVGEVLPKRWIEAQIWPRIILYYGFFSHHTNRIGSLNDIYVYDY